MFQNKSSTSHLNSVSAPVEAITILELFKIFTSHNFILSNLILEFTLFLASFNY